MRVARLAMTMALLLAAAMAFAQSPRFDIRAYAVEGNSLLSPEEIERAVAPHRGAARDFGDIQRALESLEAAYRLRGFTSVSVQLPEQEVTAGTVRFRVIEGRIGRVTVEGNRHFSAANVRAALPSLVAGQAPNAARLSENIQLANENPARQVEVLLSVGESEGRIDAAVRVTDERPLRGFVTLDNTGNEATGRNRVGVAVQHANLFDRDHVGTLAYTTAPDRPAGVKVDIWSLGYRVPIPRRGDSVEFVYAESSVGVPSSSPALGGATGILGRGKVMGARWNVVFARRGEYSARLTAGIDRRDVKSACADANGNPVVGVAGCADYLVQPASLTYSARQEKSGFALAYSVGAAVNTASSAPATYDLASSNRRAPTSFGLLRGTLGLAWQLPADWQLRANAQWQVTPHALVATEQMSLAGFAAVRGFVERAFAADRAALAQFEAYAPELAGPLGLPGSLRALGFFDMARGSNLNQPFDSPSQFNLASVGLGARYQLRRDMSGRFDVARVLRSPAVANGGVVAEDRWRAHFALVAGF